MKGTYSQIYVQFVFAIKGHDNCLQKTFRDQVFKYMSSIITAKGQKSIIVNGVEDHVHLFVGLEPSIAISDLVRDVKNNTSKFINEKSFVKSKFSWQEGYGAFSYSQSHIDRVYKYILNQEAVHKKQTFKEEYLDFLKKFEVQYDEKYLFDWIELQ
ncbi:MAG: IS200/IS605 family transposase [Saprospiraceae bacterium]